MAARPSPFKSRCLAILNFKNGACILSAHLSFFLQRRSFRGLVYFHPGIPHLKTLSGPQGGATECIVYAAIRETYCRPANNERFPRGGSLYSLRSAGKFTAPCNAPAATWWPSLVRYPRRNRRSNSTLRFARNFFLSRLHHR